MKSYDIDFEDWDSKLASGVSTRVRTEALSLNLKKVARRDYEKLSGYAHRLNLPHLIIRLLNPIIRANKELLDPATPGECAEYAMALNRIGAVEEAESILDDIEVSKFANIWLYRAFINMSRWNYSRAKTCLQKHLRLVDLGSKDEIVANVNLAACCIFLEESVQAKEYLANVIHQTKRGQNQVLFGNANELLAQVYLQEHKNQKAKSALSLAEASLRGSHGLGLFFVEKWQTVLKACECPDPKDGFIMIEDLKLKAKKISHWETIRDCEFIQAEFKLGESLQRKLYFGTPFKEYRRRLKDKFQMKVNWRQDYVFSPGSKESQHLVDVAMGISECRNLRLGPGGVLHQLLFQLTRDFYKPMTLGSIFSKLYPGEFFDPATSFDRVHKSVQRLRLELKSSGLPAGIHEHSGQYRISADQVGFIVTLKEELSSKACLELKQLKGVMKKQSLKLGEVSKLSGISESRLRRIFNDKDNSRSVRRIGSGPGTRYKLVG